MTLWMLWGTTVGALLGACAILLERVSLSRRFPARWAWVAGVAGTLALQLWPWIRSAPGNARPTPVPLDRALPFLDAAVPGDAGFGTWASATAFVARIDPVVAVAWPLASILLLGLLGLGVVKVRRAARTWSRRPTAYGEVLVSKDFGPAVVGVLSPAIVMPAWAFRLDDDLLHAAVLHEAEHRSARDTLTVFAAAVAVACTPWNPALWWMVARLRHAVEVDCDARVLAAGVSRTRYGGLLVDLSARARPLPLPGTALGRPASLLERRMTMIVRPVRSRLLPHATGLAGLAVLLFAVACEAPAPTQLRPAADPGGEAAPDLAPLSPEAQEVQELARRVSFRGDGRPLVVVDGARSDLTLDELGPSRVRRIEVLRGDAAVRRFGPEGAAGVVFVWTSDAPSAPTLGNAMDDYAPARDDGPGYAAEKKGDDASPKRVRFTGLPDDVELFVDGEPFEGELADLDPDRIDRIEVLKGERGGQVFITLK